MNALDKTGRNSKKYRELFDSMSDEQFERYIKRILKDPEESFYLEILPYQNEPVLSDIKEAADILGVPLEEYVYYRHDGNQDDPLRSKEKVPVGYLNLRRLQQILSKKNSFSMDIKQRNVKTGQVTGDDKTARISIDENNALMAMEAEEALREFMGPRSDNAKKKAQMYSDISREGYVQLQNLDSDLEDSQTLALVDVYFLGAGLKTDLLAPGLLLPRTLKGRKKRETERDRVEAS